MNGAWSLRGDLDAELVVFTRQVYALHAHIP